MGAILPFPKLDPETIAWDEYCRLVGETVRNPMLVDDDAHRELRRQAHQKFTAIFTGRAG